MAPHSSTLAWKIPWTEEPGRLQSMGSLRVGHDWATSLSLFTFTHRRRKWQPTPVFLPGESQGRRSLVGCLWGHTESDTTERLHFTYCILYHWRRKWQPTPVFLPRESQGQRSLVGCLWGHTESDRTEVTQQQQHIVHSTLALDEIYKATRLFRSIISSEPMAETTFIVIFKSSFTFFKQTRYNHILYSMKRKYQLHCFGITSALNTQLHWLYYNPYL